MKTNNIHPGSFKTRKKSGTPRENLSCHVWNRFTDICLIFVPDIPLHLLLPSQRISVNAEIHIIFGSVCMLRQ